MTTTPSPGSPATTERPPGDRLESWKEIAAYLRRDVTTAQRWEKREGMPVHRHRHGKLGSAYAFRMELDAWAATRSPAPEASEGISRGGPDGSELPALPTPTPPSAARRRQGRAWRLGSIAVGLVVAFVAWRTVRKPPAWESPLADARFLRLTDFGGVEQAAAVSRDGRFVAFQSDRDGRMDVWVTQVGAGQFRNLTLGSAPELVNASVRTLGFSPDGTLVTFWARRPGGSSPADIGIWSVPVLGGPTRPYLDGVAELDWSGDGSRLAYHTPGPGDPLYVRDATPPGDPRLVYSAPAGLHSHFHVWSPDQGFIYFVLGSLPDHLDLWRIRSGGGAPERITHHDSMVSHPVFLDARTLLYLATDADGLGPWIYGLDVEERVSRRVSVGIERYTSLAADATGRHLAATTASPKTTLWKVPLGASRAELASARPLPLATGSPSSPRLGPGYLLYVSPRGAGDGLWKLEGGQASQLWSAPEARIVGAPAIRRDGQRIAFASRQGGRTTLHVLSPDGTGERAITSALELQGAPAWRPDGQGLTVAALEHGLPHLFDVPLFDGAPAPWLAEHASDPVWSPAGDFVVFSGADVGTNFPVRAVKADASAQRLPALTLTRGARHLAFLPQRRALLVLRGDLRRKNLWAIDLETGAEQPLTDLGPDFEIRDFDVSPDGRELVLERVQHQSDIVLVERTPP